MITLPVSYVRQKGPGADQHNNDCWAASAKILLDTYKATKLSVDQFFDIAMPVGDKGLFYWELLPLLASQGLKCDSFPEPSLATLYTHLVSNKPVIVLVDYGVLVDAKLTQFTAFRGGHYMVATGADIQDVCFHDPYRTNDSGIHLAIPIPIFLRCWQAGIAPRLPIQNLSTGVPKFTHIVTPKRINVRAEAKEGSTWIRFAAAGDQVSVLAEQNGYSKIASFQWVYSAFLQPL